jgi:hypothetical protein
MPEHPRRSSAVAPHLTPASPFGVFDMATIAD